MGVFNGRDVYSPRTLTAEITDAGMNKHFVPIKNVIGDYFVVENLNNQTYVFKLEGTRIKTTKQKAAMPFQTVDYDTTHYLPVSADTKLAELVQKINSFPRYNNKLLGLMKILAKTEKRDFTVHQLPAITKELSESKDKYKQEVAELINYFKSLDIKEVVTPLGRLCDFLQDDLKTTDARYGGTIFDKAVEVDKENKKMTNTPKTARKSWFMLIAIPIIVILLGVVVYQAYEMGVFDNLGAGLGASFGKATDQQLQAQYPNCQSLHAAADSGKLDVNSLSPAVKKVYEAPCG